MQFYTAVPNKVSAAALLLAALLTTNAPAQVIDQTVNQNTATGTGGGWTMAVFGTPAAAAVSGNTYRVPSGFTLRTPNSTPASTFAGNALVVTNGGTLALKHGNGVATVNLILGPGTINNSQGPTGTTNTPVAGTLQVVANASLIGGNGAGPRHIWLQGALSGTGNLTASMFTNVLYLSGDASAYSGNWNNTGGRMEIWSGTSNPLGSGSVTLVNETNSLTLNSTNNLVLNNPLAGLGYLVKNNTNTVVLAGASTFAGGITNNAGTLVLLSPGNQSFTRVNNDAVLRVSDSTALGLVGGFAMVGANASTGRLELSNNITLSPPAGIELGMRNNFTPALVNLSGNNVIASGISLNTGGGYVGIQVNAGTTLDLQGGLNSSATGGRNFTLQGDGDGVVSGVIWDNQATPLSINKTGPGKWTLTAPNTYTGTTAITNGVLALSPTGDIASSPTIHLEPEGVLDVSGKPGFTMSANQVLRGLGAVKGNLASAFGSRIEVGAGTNYGQLYLSNNLVMNGDDIIRFKVSTATNDVLNISGSITLNGFTTNLIVLPEGYVANGTYRLINYTGTLLGAGSFQKSVPASRQTLTVDTSTPGQVNLTVSGSPSSIVWSGNGIDNLWDVNASANWNTGTEKFFQGDTVLLDDSGSAAPDIMVVEPVATGGVTVSNTANAYTLSGFGISSIQPLIKKGDNAFTLNNDGNAFSGPITIEAGTLQIGNGGATGNLGTGVITNNGQLIINRSVGGAGFAQTINGSGSFKVMSGAAVTLTGTNTYTGLTTIEMGQVSAHNNSALGDPGSGTVVLDGGRIGFTTRGPWTVAEPLEINGGGLAAAPGALYVNTDSNLVTWTGPITIGSIGSRIRAVNNYVRLNLDNSVIGNDVPLQVSSEGTGTFINFSNTLSLGLNGPLTKDGSGSAVLAGSSNRVSDLIVNLGTLVLASDNILATNTIVNGGTLQIITTNSPGIGDVTVNGGTLRIGDGRDNGSLPPGLINLVSSTSTLLLSSSNNLTLDREVTGAGRISKTLSNTVVIARSNSFLGSVTTGSGSPSPNGTGAGIIRLLNSHGLGDDFSTKTVQLIRAELQLEGGLNLPAGITFETSGGSYVVSEGAGLIPLRSVTGNNVINGNVSLIGGAGGSDISVDGGSTLTVNGTVSANTTSARTLALSGAGNGTVNGAVNNGSTTLALTKQGAGTWTLNNQNAYTGATTVQGGTLVLGANASISNTPTITLLSNAVLNVSAIPGGWTVQSTQMVAGVGTVQGSVVSAGRIAPGAPVGTLYISAGISLSGLTVMELNRTNAQNADLLSAASLVYGGELTVTNAGPELQGGDTFNLFDGSLSGAFSVTNLPALTNPNLAWDLSLLASQGIIKVTSNLPPPPNIVSPILSGTNLLFSVASEAGFNYVLESTLSLSPTNWTGIQTNPGGGLLNFTIPVNPATPTEFFRVRAE